MSSLTRILKALIIKNTLNISNFAEVLSRNMLTIRYFFIFHFKLYDNLINMYVLKFESKDLKFIEITKKIAEYDDEYVMDYLGVEFH